MKQLWLYLLNISVFFVVFVAGKELVNRFIVDPSWKYSIVFGLGYVTLWTYIFLDKKIDKMESD